MVRRQSLHGIAVVLIFSAVAAAYRPAMAQTHPSQLEQMNERLDQAARQIESLRQEVKRLQTQKPATRPAVLPPQSASSNLPEPPAKPHGMTSGYDGKHFFIASRDHDFKLTFEGQIQFRYIYNNRDNPDDGDDDVQGFQLRRAKIGVKGYIGNPRLSFKVKGAFSQKDGTMSVSDAWMGYAFNKQWNIRAGVFDDKFLREYRVSSKAQQTVERSSVAQYFWDDATKGVQVGYEGDRWRHVASFTGGPDQKKTDFTVSSQRYEWAVTGRSEFLVAGKWKEFEDFANWSDEPFGMMLGAGVSYDKGANHSGSTHPNVLKYTADVSTKLGNGINLFGAFVGQHVEADSGEPAPGADQFGFVAQAGTFVIPDKVDIFARYEYANLRGAAVDVGDNAVEAVEHDKINLITVGANYYLKEHQAKLTFDVVYTLDPLDNHVSSTSTGLLPDMGRGQIAVRTQFQLLF